MRTDEAELLRGGVTMSEICNCSQCNNEDEPEFWWCDNCKVQVSPYHVTFEETHDKRCGGCGESVRWVYVSEVL
jgi:hypothetical protein